MASWTSQEINLKQLHSYGSLIGKKVLYHNNDGQIHEGSLINVEYNQKTCSTEATIRRYRTVVIFLKKNETVSVDKLITRPALQETATPSHHGSSAHDFEYGEYYQYGPHRYLSITWKHFGVGDEVIWTIPSHNSASKQLLHGRVRFVGEYASSDGYPVIEAIVQFDHPTNHLPGYIYKTPLYRNLINVGDLQTLSSLLKRSDEESQPKRHLTPVNVKPTVGKLINVEDDSDAVNYPSILTDPRIGMTPTAPPLEPGTASKDIYPSRPPVPVHQSTFAFNERSYTTATCQHFKVGDDVVWTPRSGNTGYNLDIPFVGRVEFIGYYTTPAGYVVIDAVVQFNEETHLLPGYVYNGPTNRNLVNINELDALPSKVMEETRKQNEIDKCLTAPDYEEEESTTSEISKIKKHNANGEGFQGIQGLQNSCYMDSSIFALFAYSTIMDYIFARSENNNGNQIQRSIRTILRKDIVVPLRRNFFVPHQNMLKLRAVLAESVSREYLKDFMDVEEFIVVLFELLNIPELIKYTTGEKDYIHQIVVPMELGLPHVPYKTTQALLEKSFAMSEVKLANRPDRAFILKMPVSNGKLLGCNGVLPNLVLDLTPILDSPNAKSGESRNMSLSALIYLRNNHFVALVQTGQDETSPWIFMDSNPTSSKPRVQVLHGFSKEIETSVNEAWKTGGRLPEDQPKCGGFHLYSDAFMCIYV